MALPPLGPPREYRQPAAPQVGHQIVDRTTGASGRIVAIHPVTGDIWADWMGPVPQDWIAAGASAPARRK